MPPGRPEPGPAARFPRPVYAPSMARETMQRAGAAAAASLILGAFALLGMPLRVQRRRAARTGRYDLAGGCFALRSEQTGNYVAKAAGAYNANALIGAAEPFRMQATDLGKYLFYGPAPDFMARTALNAIAPAATPSNDSDWTITEEGSAFRIITETSRPRTGHRRRRHPRDHGR